MLELRSAARLPASPEIPPLALEGSRGARKPRRGAALGFLLVVLLPTLLFGLFQWGVAADQYSVETRFAVRAADAAPRLGAAAGLFTQMGAANTDAYAVVQHLQSAEAILAVGRHVDVREILGNPRADTLAWLDPAAPLEKALRAWRRQVRPYFDRTSGIIAVELRAFSPEDVVALAHGVERAAEELVNAMSERSRAAVLAAAQQDATAAEARLLAAREALQRFRESRQVVDPRREVEGLGAHLLRLRTEHLTATALLERRAETMRPNAPQIVALRSEIASLEAQMATLRAQLLQGGHDAGEGASLVSTMEGFSAIETEALMALRVWEGTMTGLETARADAARQRIFLAPIVRPVQPEFATHPDRLGSTLTAGAGLTLAWFVGIIALGALREHLP